MTTVANGRPGVFCDEEGSFVIYSGAKKAVGIAASSVLGETGRVCRVRRISDAALLFGLPEEGSVLTALCAMALQNGASEVAAVSAGPPGETDYPAALAALSEEALFALTCDSEDPAVHALLSQSIKEASEAGRERIGAVSLEMGDGLEEWASSFQNERLLLVCQQGETNGGETQPGCFLAAALLARLSAGSGPAEPAGGKALEGVDRLAAPLTEEQIDGLIALGITPFEERAGRVEIIRAVTSRTQTEGEEDASWRDLTTVLVSDDVLSSVRRALSLLPGAQNSAVSRRAVATQTALVLEEKRREGLLASYRAPDVRADGDDPTLCVVTLDFTVAGGFHQIVLSIRLESA